MNRNVRLALFCAVAAVALLAGFLFHHERPPEPPEADIGALMAVSYPDLQGIQRSLREWRGKVLVVNFWATWCPPCLKEIPEFVRIQERMADQGVQFIGIAADQPDKVRKFAANHRINYPILLGEMDVIEIARLAGNSAGGLPFTVLIDRQGKWVHSESGALDEPKLAKLLQPLLQFPKVTSVKQLEKP